MKVRNPRKCPRCVERKMGTLKLRDGSKMSLCPDCGLVIRYRGCGVLRYKKKRTDPTCKPNTWIDRFQHGICLNCQAATCPYVFFAPGSNRRRLTSTGLFLYKKHHARPKLARTWYGIAKQGVKP